MADDATFKAQYLSQIAADLKRIDLERDRVLTQLEALQQELAELDHNRSAMVQMQQAWAGQKGPDLPVPAGQAPGEDGGGVLQPADSRLTLRDLVLDYLGSLSGPAAVADITDALAQLYPQRRVQVPVVQNTLEGLVAKGLVVRSKRDRLVFYQPAPPAVDTASSDGPV